MVAGLRRSESPYYSIFVRAEYSSNLLTQTDILGGLIHEYQAHSQLDELILDAAMAHTKTLSAFA